MQTQADIVTILCYAKQDVVVMSACVCIALHSMSDLHQNRVGEIVAVCLSVCLSVCLCMVMSATGPCISWHSGSRESLPNLKSQKGPAIVTMLNKALCDNSRRCINQSKVLLSWFGFSPQKPIYTTSHNALTT